VAHGDGAFYKRHSDTQTGGDATSRRVLSGVAPVIGYVTVVEAHLLAALAHHQAQPGRKDPVGLDDGRVLGLELSLERYRGQHLPPDLRRRGLGRRATSQDSSS